MLGHLKGRTSRLIESVETDRDVVSLSAAGIFFPLLFVISYAELSMFAMPFPS